MAQGRSTKIISMTKWIRTSRLSIKVSMYQQLEREADDADLEDVRLRVKGLGLRV